MTVVIAQDAEMAELRGRNASLAERLITLAKGGGRGGKELEGSDGSPGSTQPLHHSDIEAAVAAMSDKNKARVVQVPVIQRTRFAILVQPKNKMVSLSQKMFTGE